jgi:hypothetical protein
VNFFNRKLEVGMTNDKEDKYEGHNDDEDGSQGDALSVKGAAPDETVNPEIQPPDLMEDEAFELTVAQSKLEELGRWNNLTIHLREAVLALGALVPPSVTPTCEHTHAPPPPLARTPPPPPSVPTPQLPAELGTLYRPYPWAAVEAHHYDRVSFLVLFSSNPM